MSACIAFLTKDLMFQSRVSSAAKSVSVALVADRSVERLLPRLADPVTIPLWIIDLTLELDDLAAVYNAIHNASPDAEMIAYGPHVHVAKLEAAAAAGFKVLTRGQFDHQMIEIIGAIAEV
jgi:hypothetical protein